MRTATRRKEEDVYPMNNVGLIIFRVVSFFDFIAFLTEDEPDPEPWG